MTSSHVAVADWRRQVAALYATLRADARPGAMRAVPVNAGERLAEKRG